MLSPMTGDARQSGAIHRVMAALHAPVYRARLEGLLRVITPHFHAGDRLLDIGCGSGALAAAIVERLKHTAAPLAVTAEGLERRVRGGEPIPVHGYDGKTIPFADDAFDVVLLADVIHHEPDPQRLLSEAARVARRLVIVKDHKPEGWFMPYARICLMDWAANAPYGVPCLYRYFTRRQWRDHFAQAGFGILAEHARLSLYPAPYKWFFTPRLQYLAILQPPNRSA